MPGLKGLRRWLAIDAEGNALGSGWNLGRFDPLELVFITQKRADKWQADGCRYVRLLEGNLARIVQEGSNHRNIAEYKHGPIRRCRRAKKLSLTVLEIPK